MKIFRCGSIGGAAGSATEMPALTYPTPPAYQVDTAEYILGQSLKDIGGTFIVASSELGMIEMIGIRSRTELWNFGKTGSEIQNFWQTLPVELTVVTRKLSPTRFRHRSSP
eukprot:752470-Hanusia_phi.AAC.4